MSYFVYYNLHKHLWSLRDQKSRRVRNHCEFVFLRDATFKVSEAGRQRVLREKKKNVHAGVVGTLCTPRQLGPTWVRVRYNPYETSTFVEAETGRPVLAAKQVMLTPDRKVWAEDVTYLN